MSTPHRFRTNVILSRYSGEGSRSAGKSFFTPEILRGVPLRMTVLVVSALVVSLWPIYSVAAPTQQEVFKSISDNVGSSTDPKKFAAFILAVTALAILLVVLSKRKQRQVTPKILNHQGKLLKEIIRHIDLRPAEIRQLKILAEEQNLSSPLTLLLCPSILAKAVKERSGKVDRKAILSVAKKLG